MGFLLVIARSTTIERCIHRMRTSRARIAFIPRTWGQRACAASGAGTTIDIVIVIDTVIVIVYVIAIAIAVATAIATVMATAIAIAFINLCCHCR